MRRGSLVISIIALMAIIAAGTHASTDSSPSAFVRVRGTEFVIGDEPFRFVGANVSVMHGENERKSYEAILDAVKQDGLRVVRIWALGEYSIPGKPHTPLYAFRIGERGWVEESFTHLDRVLEAARVRGLRVIIVLANRWKDYGGLNTYLSWASASGFEDQSGNVLGTALSKFYDCARCKDLYQEHLSRVVGRVNTVNNVPYRDDPTIMAWELINEASAVTARDEDTLIAWISEQARFIRALDPNHLISAGHVGYHTQRERNVWQRVQALPEIDFADAHAYPRSDPRVSNAARLARFIDEPIAIALAGAQKPMVFGEVGFEDEKGARAGAARARWLGTFLRQAAQRGASGALVWHYEPSKNPRRRHSISEDPNDRASMRVRRALATAVSLFDAPWRSSQIDLARILAASPVPFVTSARSAPPAHRSFVTANSVQVLDIDPIAFARAEFERAGVYREGALDVVYGAGQGFVEYRFISPPETPRAFRVEARISSELPGYSLERDQRDGSDIEVSLDGVVIGTVRAPPDDGFGDIVTVELRDAHMLSKIFGHARHTLRFTALPSRYAGGLCLYGKATGVMPLESSLARAIDTIRLSLVP